MKKLKDIFCSDVCLTSRKSILVIIVIGLTTVVLANITSTKEIEIETTQTEEVWVPTEEDIAYQDSMYQIIQTTQEDVIDIKKDIVYIIEILDDDSIRYVEGGKIDTERN